MYPCRVPAPRVVSSFVSDKATTEWRRRYPTRNFLKHFLWRIPIPVVIFIALIYLFLLLFIYNIHSNVNSHEEFEIFLIFFFICAIYACNGLCCVACANISFRCARRSLWYEFRRKKCRSDFSQLKLLMPIPLSLFHEGFMKTRMETTSVEKKIVLSGVRRRSSLHNWWPSSIFFIGKQEIGRRISWRM